MMSKVQESDSPIYSFAPIADSRSKVLIMGTIPGKESLKMNVYYAHPQNAFWKNWKSGR
jgi:hypoxanthine-DNA glycosylase